MKSFTLTNAGQKEFDKFVASGREVDCLAKELAVAFDQPEAEVLEMMEGTTGKGVIFTFGPKDSTWYLGLNEDGTYTATGVGVDIRNAPKEYAYSWLFGEAFTESNGIDWDFNDGCTEISLDGEVLFTNITT